MYASKIIKILLLLYTMIDSLSRDIYNEVMIQKRSADSIQIKKDQITYELTPEKEGGYMVQVADYPSCVSEGETIDEALAMIEDALCLCLETDKERGFSLPPHLESWFRLKGKHEKADQKSAPGRAYSSV